MEHSPKGAECMLIDILSRLSQRLTRKWHNNTSSFDSQEYWEQRYKNNGTSGEGSYNHFANFKADFLNTFVEKAGVKSILEFGCGDGNQLQLARYPSYVGFDVSPTSIRLCKKMFSEDITKKFYLSSEPVQLKGDLTLSLDVIYHLIEDNVYHSYMETLFRSSTRWVIVYSSNTNNNECLQSIHVKHRRFTDWVQDCAPKFKLVQHVPNKYPLGLYGVKGSFADFYVFEGQSSDEI
jgi:SAM-dependent methyltransferase